MINGRYILDLYCDVTESPAHGKHSEFPHQFTGKTYQGCSRDAQIQGWRISYDRRLAICPACSKAGLYA